MKYTRETALMYIKLMKNILQELQQTESSMTPERKKILQHKINKYKNYIEQTHARLN